MMIRPIVALLSCLLLLGACSEEQSSSATVAQTPEASPVAAQPDSEPVGQLPEGIRPLRYVLDFTIIPDDSHFSGHASIEVELAAATDLIWLHGQDLEVSQVRLISGDTTMEASYSEHGKEGVAQLKFEQAVPAGTAMIEIEYRAPFNEELAGLYKVEESGQSYAFSQMEAIDARKAFPSFDEPRFKTPFQLTITTRAEYSAITNSRMVSSQLIDGGLQRTRFAETPPLPTYLIAFTVGPVDVVEWEAVPATEFRDHPLPLRGIAAKGKGEQLTYALENTAAMVIILENYFGTAYPYDKLDIVAAPDFRAGAMENAGLIIYRESLLLLDDNPPLQQQRAYASVHAHELAHQWFGNLVTMPWWDDIWLNEAFATWMGHKAVHTWRPEYHYDRNMQQRAMGAMDNDSLLSARQIREPVPSNDQIENAFDGITYSKGGGVLSMFETWLGEDAFKAGIRDHMQRFAHGNATVFDFIESLSRVAPDKDVDKAFRSFLFQPGVPFVEIELDCSGERAQARLSQRRYLPVGTEDSEEHNWSVPVCMSYGVDEQVREECVLLDAPEQTVELGSALTCPDWIMPNRNGAGYYRFSQSGPAMSALAEAAETHLNTREKIALADSLEAALNNGTLDANAFLSAVEDLASATERAVVTAPIGALNNIQYEYLDEAQRQQARKWARRIYGDRLARLADPKGAESAMEATLLRTALIDYLTLSAADPELTEQMIQAGHAYLGWGGDGKIHADAVEPELLNVALEAAGEQADGPFFEHMLEHLKKSDAALTRNALVAGLARVRDPALQLRSLELVFSDHVRVNEIPSLLFGGMVFHNRERTWQWVQENFDRLTEALPDRFQNFLPYVASGFCDPQQAAELTALMEPRLEQMPGAKRALDQSLEYIGQCAALRDHQAASARAFFAAQEI
jgi:alanyl aminopeptidase